MPPKQNVDAACGVSEVLHRRLQWEGPNIHLPVLNTVQHFYVIRKVPIDENFPLDRQKASSLLCNADFVTPATVLPASITATIRERMGRWLLGVGQWCWSLGNAMQN